MNSILLSPSYLTYRAIREAVKGPSLSILRAVQANAGCRASDRVLQSRADKMRRNNTWGQEQTLECSHLWSREGLQIPRKRLYTVPMWSWGLRYALHAAFEDQG